jgi:hypothetical protein
MTPEGRGLVIPEKSGIHSFLSSSRNRGSRNSLTKLDSRLRWNDSEAKIVIPEKSGIHSFLSSPRNRGSRNSLTKLDSRLRGNDSEGSGNDSEGSGNDTGRPWE